jgi:hypothetical protein
MTLSPGCKCDNVERETHLAAGEGAADYAETILALDTPEGKRRRMVVGVSRPTSESQMWSLVRERIREQQVTPE